MCRLIERNIWVRAMVQLMAAGVFMLLLGINVTPVHSWMLNDGAVFYTMGQAVLHGKVLYLDVFDNKGAVLYFLQALAGLIAPAKWGLYLLSTLWLAVSLELIYRIGRRVGATIGRTLCGEALYLVMLQWCMWQGNTTEEWSMPFILASIYILILICQGGTRWLCYALTVGVCFGMVLMISVINTAPIVGVALYIGYRLLRDKRGDVLWRSVLCFLGGAALIVGPVWGYFYLHDAFAEMYYATVTFNMKYKARMVNYGDMRVLHNTLRMAVCIVLPVLAYRKAPGMWVALAIVCAVVYVAYFDTFGKCHYYLIISPLILLTWLISGWCRRRVQTAVMVLVLIWYYSPSHSPINTVRESYSMWLGHGGELLAQRDSVMSRVTDMIPDEEIWNVYLIEGWNIAQILNSRDATPVGRFFTGHIEPIHIDPAVEVVMDREFEKASPQWIISVDDIENTAMAKHGGGYYKVMKDSVGPLKILLYRRKQ